MRTLNNFDHNHLLASLLEAGSEGLRSRLELLPLAFGDVLYEADSKLVHVYFPTTSVVSMLSVNIFTDYIMSTIVRSVWRK